MKKNFAQQPEGGGMIVMLTANDLSTDITDFNSNKIFQKRPNFIDNCNNNPNCNCKNCSTMKNANGFAIRKKKKTRVTSGYASGYTSVYGNPKPKIFAMKNASGYGGGGGGLLDGLNLGTILGSAATLYGNSQQIKLAQETAAIKAREEEIARQNARAEKERTDQAEFESGGAVAKIKAYALPIAITGGVIIVGIAAYFFFKKKKID
jgi:hypothetical protein